MGTSAAVICSVVCLLLQCITAQESGETETVRFTYDSHTHMLLISRQATCYIFVLTADQRTLVHDDTAMRRLELTFLKQLSDPSLPMNTVPKLSLHSNILHGCGKGIAQYHIIQ